MWKKGQPSFLARHKFLLVGFPLQSSVDVPGGAGEMVGAGSKVWLW